MLLSTKGDGKSCVEHSKNGIRNAEDANMSAFIASGWYLSGTGYHYIGDISAAREQIEEAKKIQTEHAIVLNLCHSYNSLSNVHCDSGDLKNAHRCAEKALELSRTYNEILGEGTANMFLGRVLGIMDSSSIGEAEASLLKGMKICEDFKAKPLLFQGCLYLGELYTNTGRKEKAMENLTRAEAAFKEMGMDCWLARTYAAYTELYKNEGDLSKASENLARAINIMKELEADGWVERYEKAMQLMLE